MLESGHEDDMKRDLLGVGLYAGLGGGMSTHDPGVVAPTATPSAHATALADVVALAADAAPVLSAGAGGREQGTEEIAAAEIVGRTVTEVTAADPRAFSVALADGTPAARAVPAVRAWSGGREQGNEEPTEGDDAGKLETVAAAATPNVLLRNTTEEMIKEAANIKEHVLARAERRVAWRNLEFDGNSNLSFISFPELVISSNPRDLGVHIGNNVVEISDSVNNLKAIELNRISNPPSMKEENEDVESENLLSNNKMDVENLTLGHLCHD